MTVQEAAERLRVTPARVGQYIKQGRLRAERFGRAWALTSAEVEAFAAEPRPVGWKRGRPRKIKGASDVAP